MDSHFPVDLALGMLIVSALASWGDNVMTEPMTGPWTICTSMEEASILYKGLYKYNEHFNILFSSSMLVGLLVVSSVV